MRAKLLRHPAATTNGLPRRRSVAPEVLAQSGLPPWFYWFSIAGLTFATILGPPFNIPVLIILWIYYLHNVISCPERAIFVFLMTVVLIKMVSVRGIPLIPGMNSDTLFIVSLGVCAVMSRERQPQPPVPNPLLKPVVFFAIVMVFSALLSFGMGRAMHHSFARGWVPYSGIELFSDLKTSLFYLFLPPIAFRLLWNRRQLVTALSVVAIYTAYISLEALGSRGASALGAGDSIPRFLRAGGSLFREPNVLGGFLAIASVVMVPVIMSGKLGLRMRILVTASTVVATIALVVSFSRGAWVAALGGFLIISVLRGARGMLVVFLLALTATLWMPQAVIDRYENTIRTKSSGAIEEVSLDNSTESRIARWKAVPGMFWKAPIIGHGYKSFSKNYGLLNEKGHDTGPHSTITAIIVEEGLIGMLAYAFLLGAMFWGAYRLIPLVDDPVVKALAIGVAACIPTLALLDVTGNRLTTLGVTAPIWLLVGGVARQYANLRYAVDAPVTVTTRSSS